MITHEYRRPKFLREQSGKQEDVDVRPAARQTVRLLRERASRGARPPIATLTRCRCGIHDVFRGPIRCWGNIHQDTDRPAASHSEAPGGTGGRRRAAI